MRRLRNICVMQRSSSQIAKVFPMARDLHHVSGRQRKERQPIDCGEKTTLAKREPNDLFSEMRKEMNDLMTSWFGRPQLASWGNVWPQADKVFTPLEMRETDTDYMVKMDIPGAKEEDIKVSCQGNQLVIRGERKEEKQETKGDVRYSERQYGMFSRTVDLPANAKHDSISAKYKDGVLEIHVPKTEKTPSRDIKVERPAT